jgi:anti-anti-sigma factor
LTDLRFDITPIDALANTARVVVEGAIDATTVISFESQLKQLQEDGYTNFVLDMQGIKYVNSTGLGSLVATADNLEKVGGGLALIRVHPKVKVVFDMRGNSNETMWSWRQEGRARVIEERPMRYMNHMMYRVVQGGTGTVARMEGRQVGGKTGTGNDYRDAWFIGFTPGMVAGVWAGNDDFSETGRVTGGSLPAEIWARFMPTALRNTPARELQMPRPEDYDTGLPNPDAPELTVVGAPFGAVIGAPTPPPPDNQDRSLDFGPEG